MTEQTRSLISEFAAHPGFGKVSYIILSMQEEDGVAEALRYKNCFKALRNIAAHEPEVIARQLVSSDNYGNQKVLFETSDGTIVVLDMLQFAIWMFDMYLLTKEKAYIQFIVTLYHLMYPEAFRRFTGSPKFKFKVVNGTGLLVTYDAWVSMMYRVYGVIRPIALSDPYICKLYKENKKVFWKVAVPDMMNLICFYLSGSVDLYDVENLTYFTMLYTAREGLV